MVRFAIACKHQAANDFWIWLRSKKAAQRSKRFCNAIDTDYVPPGGGYRGAAAHVSRDFFEQRALGRGTSHQEQESHGQGRKYTKSKDDCQCHGLDLHINNLANR